MERGQDFVAMLRRWEDAGGLWQVLGRHREEITVGLYRCDGGEEVDGVIDAQPFALGLGPVPDGGRPAGGLDRGAVGLMGRTGSLGRN